MRKIVFLVAASIMFAATLPASAQQRLSQTCEAVTARAWNKAKKVCLADQISEDTYNKNVAILEKLGHDKAIQIIVERLNGTEDIHKVCSAAILAAFTACDRKLPNWKAKYNPDAQPSTRAPISTKGTVPPAGLLETTPGLTPQGPAAGGTPGATIGAPSRVRGQ
jgi:hypothetical protein